jgi:hypothetical protein
MSGYEHLATMSREELEYLALTVDYNLKQPRYQKDPLFWVEDRLGEDSSLYRWSKIGNYE